MPDFFEKKLSLSLFFTFAPLLLAYIFAFGCASYWSLEYGWFYSDFCKYTDNILPFWALNLLFLLSAGIGFGLVVYLLIRGIIVRYLTSIKLLLYGIILLISEFFLLSYIDSFLRFLK